MTIGLHRPFNMPLKSLVWMCRFCKTCHLNGEHDFYIDFFLWMMRALVDNSSYFDEQNAEGVVKPQNARAILEMFDGWEYEDIKKGVRGTLRKRASEKDRLIYNSYKNTSYYMNSML